MYKYSNHLNANLVTIRTFCMRFITNIIAIRYCIGPYVLKQYDTLKRRNINKLSTTSLISNYLNISLFKDYHINIFLNLGEKKLL
jgi:hypothetical protein